MLGGKSKTHIHTYFSERTRGKLLYEPVAFKWVIQDLRVSLFEWMCQCYSDKKTWARTNTRCFWYEQLTYFITTTLSDASYTRPLISHISYSQHHCKVDNDDDYKPYFRWKNWKTFDDFLGWPIELSAHSYNVSQDKKRHKANQQRETTHGIKSRENQVQASKSPLLQSHFIPPATSYNNTCDMLSAREAWDGVPKSLLGA